MGMRRFDNLRRKSQTSRNRIRIPGIWPPSNNFKMPGNITRRPLELACRLT